SAPRNVRTSPYSRVVRPHPVDRHPAPPARPIPGHARAVYNRRREGRRRHGAPMQTVSPDGHHKVDPARLTTRDEFRDALNALRESAGLTVREAARAAKLP